MLSHKAGLPFDRSSQIVFSKQFDPCHSSHRSQDSGRPARRKLTLGELLRKPSQHQLTAQCPMRLCRDGVATPSSGVGSPKCGSFISDVEEIRSTQLETLGTLPTETDLPEITFLMDSR